MNTTRTYKSFEARNATALRLKVLSKQAAGWVVDGPALLVTGYTKSDWVCVGGTYSKNAQTGVETITLGLGGSATCTITNDDNAPALHLRKTVVNDNGGQATVADFPLSADGTARRSTTTWR